jgi:2-methylcitrate dehydratase PrpD
MTTATAAAHKSITLELAEYAAGTSADAIPAAVQEQAKKVIFDELASACFGARSTPGVLAARYAATFGGAPECRVLGTDTRTSAPLAALVNGTAGHGEEVDGAHVVGGHPGATIVHAVVAVAERQRATGADVLNAVVLGYDVGTRLIQACGRLFGFKQRYHLHSDFLHAIAAAVSGSRVLGLDAGRHVHAMALATFQANGLCSLFQEDRHISKSFCNGQYAFAGVSAALMASSGLEGCVDVLGTREGLFDAWGTEDAAATIMRGLGSDFAVMGANFKFVNAGYPIHAAVEAATALVKHHGLHVDDIAAVEIGMPANAMRVVDNRDMHNICVQDTLTAALVRGGLHLREDPFPIVLDDAGYRRLRAAVTLDVDPELERDQPNGRGARVALRLLDGTVRSERVDHPRGHSLRGAPTWEDLAEKWREGLPRHDVELMLSFARELQDIDDITTFVDAFGGTRFSG